MDTYDKIVTCKLYIFRKEDYVATIKIIETHENFSIAKIIPESMVILPKKGDIVIGDAFLDLIKCYKLNTSSRYREVLDKLILELLISSQNFWKSYKGIIHLCRTYRKFPQKIILLKFEIFLKKWSYNPFIVELFACYLVEQRLERQAKKMFRCLYNWSYGEYMLDAKKWKKIFRTKK